MTQPNQTKAEAVSPYLKQQIEEVKKLLETVHLPWMRNGKGSAGWRIDDTDENRIGLTFLLSPTALVAKESDADLIEKGINLLPDLIAEIDRRSATVDVGELIEALNTAVVEGEKLNKHFYRDSEWDWIANARAILAKAKVTTCSHSTGVDENCCCLQCGEDLKPEVTT